MFLKLFAEYLQYNQCDLFQKAKPTGNRRGVHREILILPADRSGTWRLSILLFIKRKRDSVFNTESRENLSAIVICPLALRQFSVAPRQWLAVHLPQAAGATPAAIRHFLDRVIDEF